MESHIREILEISNKLASLGESLKDHLIAAMLLASLSDSYEPLIAAIESRPENELTLDFVKSKLIDDYRRRKENSKINDCSGTVMKSISKVRSNTGKSNFNCFFCKNEGHLKRDSPKYRKWMKKQLSKELANIKKKRQKMKITVYC